MALTEDTTGNARADGFIRMARLRGLHVTIDRSRGTFVSVKIDNHGLAGENGLNNQIVSLYVSFSQSKRGRWCGGHYFPLLGTDRKLRKDYQVASAIEMMYVTDDNLTDFDREARKREHEEYLRLVARIEQLDKEQS